ncbi:zinc finger BED domain-containing protein 4 [Bemisia tabaci]|uniref:zinc finger BED domain-containing protein 4 n=1 Tax=Bemisia tabaci TaxID=7038 RepID=UPI003B27FB16
MAGRSQKRKASANLKPEFETISQFEKRCRRCKQMVKTCGNTTNLKQHFLRKHEEIYHRLLAAAQQAENPDPDDPDAPDEVPEQVEAVAGPSRESDPPRVPSTVTPSRQVQQPSQAGTSARNLGQPTMPAEADPQRVPSTATPSRQSQQPSRAGTPARNLSQPTMPATFNTSNSFKIGGARDKQLVNALMFMIAKDNEPFRIVEKEGFRYFCSVAVPQFQIPGKTKITYLMDKKFSELKTLVKDTSFKDIDYICITFDVWTDTMNHKSYLGITAHFMENGKLASLILNTVHLEERHLGVNIKNKVEETFKDWGLRTLQIVLVVTDGAANMVNAANLLTGNEDKHLHCIAHVLNLIAEVVLANPFLAPLLAPVKVIITAFIQSYILSDELRDAQPPGEALKLMQSVITRWNSEFYMIQRFLKLKDYISGVLINHPDSVQMISARKVSELQEVMTLLEPLEEMTRHLSLVI